MSELVEETEEVEAVGIDFEEELDFVAKATGLDKELIERVLDADFEFLKSKGIVETEDEE
jgi:hypothetical protein